MAAAPSSEAPAAAADRDPAACANDALPTILASFTTTPDGETLVLPGIVTPPSDIALAAADVAPATTNGDTTHLAPDTSRLAALPKHGHTRRPSVVLLPGAKGEDADIAFELANTLDSVYHDDEIKLQLQAAFLRAAAAGDLRKVAYLLKHCANDIEVDGRDENGSTALMQAACFGYLQVVQRLIQAGADADLQDNNGWTALMWATNNNRTAVVEYLLARGAATDMKSRSGRSVRDFLARAHLPEQDNLVSIFYSDARSVYTTRKSSSSSDDDDTRAVSMAGTSISTVTSDSYYVPSLYGVDYRELCAIVGTTVPASLAQVAGGGGAVGGPTSTPVDQLDPQIVIDEEDEGLVEFSWESCPPSQMFVFSESSLDHLLHVTIRRLADPNLIRSQNTNPAGYTRRPVSANILFLAARYAGYYASQDLLDALFSRALDLLEHTLRPRRHDMMVLGYWLSNCSRLLYYLKKDTGLVIKTLPYQVRLNELIQDIFMALLRDAQHRLSAVIDDALLNHDTIPGFASLKFRERTREAAAPPSATGLFGISGPGSVSSVSSASSSSGGNGNGNGGGSPVMTRARDAAQSMLRRTSSTPNLLDRVANDRRLNRLSSLLASSTSSLLNPNTPSATLPRLRAPTANGGSAAPQPSSASSPGTRRRPVSTPGAPLSSGAGMNGGNKRTPRTVTTILSSTLYVLQTFHVHPSLVHQAIEQLFFYLGATTFNRLLSRPDLCCRWKAMQIRMNLSHLEEWVRSNPIPAPARDTFTKHLQPVISMLQLLQIITHFKLLETFIEALRESDHLHILNWSQLRRAIDLYTYEQDEPDVVDAIANYVARCADRAAQAAAAHRAAGFIRDVDAEMAGHAPDSVAIPPALPPRPDGRRRSSIIDLSITTLIRDEARHADPAQGLTADDLPDPMAAPPPLELDALGRVVPVTAPPPPPRPRPLRRPSAMNPAGAAPGLERIKGPVVAVAAVDPRSGDPAYTYFMLDEKYWLPFAVPPNVGERSILRVIDGEEVAVEEAPVLSDEIVEMLDEAARRPAVPTRMGATARERSVGAGGRSPGIAAARIIGGMR
ncbi:hypothetical protein AMAG_14402 [Allomyces macrogynus ATCC 38327]|uniref:Dilute domain-containing protein n=1 Tax=Allomyces macrogynus (strain ATCC 38327) TaxID=578462 RepID=A0A0L0T6D8_ALLM3|nr:hypothetical protein AMAG_14402 [Allomyces macrogynus ATCC 38327]|eukprot:KNE70251.1 hypothetical protein AMAG_14402 [Allomyces macrogynus ATCC 38327]